MQIASLAYGNVTGRITAIAIDPADPTGNTVYLGTTGGGVWKSTNAAGDPASVKFIPLTDTLPVFNAGAGTNTIASLSIGGLAIANGVILAGTGDTNDALDSYSGSGILRSADGGATWTLVQLSQDGVNGIHFFIGLGFSALAWSTTSPSIAVAAVSDAAEGELVNAPSTTQSVRGLYYSTDAGVTWQMAVIKDGQQIVQSPQAGGSSSGGNAATSVIWNPVRQRFYAAIRYHGYYESPDGSVWTRLAAQPGVGLTASACPANPGLTGSASCPIFRGTLAVQPVSGDTFAFTVDGRLGDQGIWRDICAAANSACASSTVSFASQLDATPLEQEGGTIPQGDYDLSLAAVASGSDTLLFAGTVDLYRCSLAAGCSFRDTTNTENGCSAPAQVAPSQHAIAVLSAPSLLYLGNDGGLWRSTDGVGQQQSPCSSDDANHFQNLNGRLGSLAETVNFSQDPSNADTLIIGAGSNGTAATTAASAGLPWAQLAAGEGGFTAIDPVTSANWYISTGPGVSIAYCAKGAACAASDFSGLPTIGAVQTAQDDSLIDTPWLLDPSLLSNIIVGTCRVWRGPSQDGSSWNGATATANAISQQFGGPQDVSCALNNAYIRSLAAGGPAATVPPIPNMGSKTLYAGMAGVLDGGGSLGGHILATSAADTANAATAWSDLALSPVSNDAADGSVFNPAGFDISSVTVDPHDPTGATVYATVMGFSGNNINAPHLYQSTDAGAHWTNLTANLPDAPANSVIVDPNDANVVYIALDTGVYVTSQIASCAAQNCWSIFGAGLPNSPVIQLLAGAALPAGGGPSTVLTGLLRAATYGRGIWQVPLLTAAPPTSPQIAMSPQSLAFAGQIVGSVSPPGSITVTNTGNAALVISSLATTGDFAETDNCAGSPLAAGASCTAQVVFRAASPGTSTGVLTFYANIAGGQSTATLTGIGVVPSAVVLNPLSLDFGSVTVGQTTAPQLIKISNTGGVAATLQPPVVAGDFQITANTCAASLAFGAVCTIGIIFSPSTAGTRNGSLSLATSAGTQLVSLTGRGASDATDSLSPASLSFPPQLAGTSSPAQTVTLTNSGDTALTQIAAQTSPGFTVVNGCGTSLAGHAACTFAVTFAPSVAGPQSGTLTISDEFRSQTVALFGIGLAPPAVQLSPTSLSFIPIAAGQSSLAQSIAISNSGTGQLEVASITVTGAFTESDDCAGKVLARSNICHAQVTFSPSSAGALSGLLSVLGTAAGQQALASLSGTGLAPATLVLTPGSLDFGTITTGTTSTAQNITVANTGAVSTSLTTPVASGDFTLSGHTCTNTLAPSTSCTLSIVFKPTVSGARTGSLSITSSAGTAIDSLNGIGATPATDSLTPASLSFAPQQAGTSSSTQPVTLSNTGDNTLTLIAVQAPGGDFIATSHCGTQLAGHSTCTIDVAFAPTVGGAISGSLTISDESRSQTIALSGTATSPPAIGPTPATLSFPGTAVSQTSASQTLQIANTGGGQLTVTSVAISGDFTESDACAGKTLTGSATCAVQVAFAPSAIGPRTGLVTVFGSVAGTSAALEATAVLTGTGLAPAAIVLTPGNLSFGTITLGASSAPPQNITISNTGGVTATLQTPAITGDFAITANTCGNTLAASSGCTVAIVFTPTSAGARTGTLSITGSAGTQTVALSGTGASAATDALSPQSLSFTQQQVGTSSASQTVTLTNTGDNALTLIAASVTGGNFTAANNCGPQLSGHASCTIAVAFTPTVNGAISGSLIVSDQFRSQTVALSGIGFAPPGVGLSTATLSFPRTAVGQSSASQTVQISNFGGGQLMVTSVAISGDFTESDTCAGKTLAGSATCTIQVTFLPTANGIRTGILTVAGSIAGASVALQATAALTGSGEAPATIVLSPASLSFGTVTIGSSSTPAQNITISNTGGVAATLQAPTITADFAISANTCGTTLPASTGCTFAIVFTPTASGTRTGTFSITGSGGIETATLTGTGASAATDTLYPLSLTFAPQQVGTSSPTQSVTLTNVGDNPLTLIAALAAGGSFIATSACGTSLSGHSSCSIAVGFFPSAVGPVSGVLTISDQFRSQSVALSGTGLAPPGVSLTPAGGLTFAATGVAQLSAAQTVTLSDQGGLPLTIGGISLTGDFILPASLNTCGATVAAGASCTLQVVFVPIAAGARTGTLSIADNAAASPQTLALQGTGIDFSLTANGASSVTISSGQSAVYPLLLSSLAGTPGSAALSCTGAPANSTCTVVPSTAPLGGTATISATVQTGMTSTASLPPTFRTAFLAMLFPLCLLGPGLWRLRRRAAPLRPLLALSISIVLFGMVGCGSGRTIPGGGGGGGGSGPPPPITPSGTYTITVTATSAGLTRSVPVTLIVQ